MIDHRRKPVGRAFRSELADISLGGLAFLIRITKRENARLLLGRTMRITVPIAGEEKHLFLEGVALSLHLHHAVESDFSVHIRFVKPLTEETLKKILG